MNKIELENKIIIMFLSLLLPLLLFKTYNISNSAIILTPRSNIFREDMVAHLFRKFSAFCRNELHCRLHIGPSLDYIPSLFNSFHSHILRFKVHFHLSPL